jgi:bisphosphoglycerate-independent phosphoglycerate mutase
MLSRLSSLPRSLQSLSRPLSSSSKPLAVLTILDGWGYRETSSNNAVVLARTPNFDALYGTRSQRGQVAFLDACEGEVGLPVGQIGNSEVGHMNIGAGRIVWQDIGLINRAVEEGSIPAQPAFRAHVDRLRASGGTCHLLGCLSPGGVHATQEHMAAIANAVSAEGVPVVVHGFTDGRDVPPQDAEKTLPAFLALLDEGVTVGTITGRYGRDGREAGREEERGLAQKRPIAADASCRRAMSEGNPPKSPSRCRRGRMCRGRVCRALEAPS